MNRSRTLLLSLAPASLAALAALVACGTTPVTSREPAAATPVAVRTARATLLSEDWTETPGTIEAVASATVASRLSAIIERVAVEEGAVVRRGDLLVRLDSRDIAAQVAAASAVERAARAHRDRIRGLFEKEAATRQELEQAEQQDASAVAAVDAAKSQLDYLNIRAPIAGVVSAKMVNTGDLAAAGRPLLVVHDASALRVAATVSEEDAGLLNPGREVQARLDDGTILAARVSIVAPGSDPHTRRVLVKCDLPAGSKARVGAFARLRLPSSAHAGPVVLVPKGSLVEHGALSGLFVVEQGRARLRWISPGEPRGDAVTVRSGLAAGEEVVLDPGRLSDGDPVTPTLEEPAR